MRICTHQSPHLEEPFGLVQLIVLVRTTLATVHTKPNCQFCFKCKHVAYCCFLPVYDHQMGPHI